MAILVSPGVDVQIIEESMYGSAGPGTVPLIVFATRSNKASPTGVGIAPGTIAGEAGKLYLATSQRELNQTFGNPYFTTVQGTPVHGHELNEYGLHAAYQFLGINNRAYVMRADIDLEQLESSVSAPRGNPVDGTYWLDLVDSQFGVFQSTGATSLDPFLKQNVLVVSDRSQYDAETGLPVDGFGEDGDFCVITAESHNRIFERIDGSWLLLGSQAWKFTRNVVRGTNPMAGLTAGDSFSINGITVTITTNNITQTVLDINAVITASASLNNKVTASTDSAGRLSLNFVLPSIELYNVTGSPLEAMSITEGKYDGVKLAYAPHNRVPQKSVFGDVWIKTTAINNGSKLVVKVARGGSFSTVEVPFYKDDATAKAALSGSLTAGALYVQFNTEGTDAAPLAGHSIKRWTGNTWADLSYEASYNAPASEPEDGTLWFNADFRADIMVGDGDQWLGYRQMYPQTDASGIQIAGSAPITQLNGNGLVDNDLWLDASDLENYPKIYRFQEASRRWVSVDNTDQTTPYGIVFADAREDSGQDYLGQGEVEGFSYVYNSDANEDMVLSNYVDPDCIDPRTFSAGTLLFNTRYSTYNVKKWNSTWFAEGSYDENTDFTQNTYTVGRDDIMFAPVEKAGRWVTASGNAVDGSPYMGRKAQRQMVVTALAACIAGNQEIRSELVYYNLLAAPGYPEMIDEMITLNVDQKEVAFIVGDTPARLKPSGTAIQKWATNANNAASNGDKGLTSANPYVGLYYPWGLSTNVDGTEIMVPPSTIALRTIAYNDQVAYPWFAPAGFTRGLVSNAASVGYLSDEGEYTPVILNAGQRDVLYLNKINPIAYMPNRGLVVYGQKTLSPIEAATDRINVARLANYMKYNLDNLAKPFLFEQNDLQTRDAFKITIERFLVGLVGLRALEDFAVLCDTSNNTPERRDRNELWCDIFIKPLKAVEFIYLPVRIRNSGDSLN
jgi:hypothetical protein